VKIRSHLVLLVLATTLPLLLFVGAVIALFADQQRAAGEREMRDSAHTLALALDRELHASVTALEALASSDNLDRDDLSRFYQQAQQVMKARPWNTMVLADPSGQQLMNLFRPFGTKLPPRGDLTAHRQAIATRRPAVSNIFVGAVTRDTVVSVEVPVIRDGAPKYVLVGSLRLDALGDILTNARLSPAWTASILDGHKKVIARSRDAQQYVGKSGGPLLSLPPPGQHEGWLKGTQDDGTPSYAAFSRSSVAPWYVVVVAPANALDAPLKRLWLIAGLGLAILIAGLGLAMLLAQRIARPVSELAVAANALQHDEALPPLMTSVNEVNRVGASIGDAAALLRQRAKERDAILESERRARADAETANRAKDEMLAALERGEESARRLAALVEFSDDAIIGKTVDGVITSWNRGAERIFGWTEAEATGRHITLIVPEDLRAEEGEVLARIRRDETVDHFETTRVTKDGRRLNISLTVSPIKDANGRVVGASTIARDVTERKSAEAERARLLSQEHAARVEAEAANRAKDEFLAVLSHELRTPLNAVVGWAKMLHAGEVDPDRRTRALDTIMRNANAQVQLIDDLLDVSRVITGKMRLDVQPVDLKTVVEGALDAVGPAAAAKAIRLQPVLDPRAGPITGDPGRLQQVVWNLLSNAVKFTPKGGRIQVHLQRVNSHVEIVVSDTGIGIAAEILPFVFDRFRQADSSSTRSYSGLGLGLAVAKHLVELHGGSITAQSAGEGQGATFIVKLPLTIAEVAADAMPRVHPTAAPIDRAMPEIRLGGLRILVVDDDPDALDLALEILATAGATVRTCLSVPEGVQAVRQWRPDVLISDIEMPGEDGYSFIRRVRALSVDEGGKTPAVALTAYGRTEDRMRSLAAGYNMHVPKPVNPGELRAIIASLAGRTIP
jgi:PAS domain S-box-containing protein